MQREIWAVFSATNSERHCNSGQYVRAVLVRLGQSLNMNTWTETCFKLAMHSLLLDNWCLFVLVKRGVACSMLMTPEHLRTRNGVFAVGLFGVYWRWKAGALLYCVRQLCTMTCVHKWTVLKFAYWFRFHFVFTARCYASAVYAVVMCPSVCPSIRLSHGGIVTKRPKVKSAMPHDSPWTLVFWRQKSRRNSDGVTPNRGAKLTWGKFRSAIFDQHHASRYVSTRSSAIATHYVSKFVLFHDVKCDLQGHWQGCHSIGLPMQPCLYLTPFPRYHHPFDFPKFKEVTWPWPCPLWGSLSIKG